MKNHSTRSDPLFVASPNRNPKLPILSISYPSRFPASPVPLSRFLYIVPVPLSPLQSVPRPSRWDRRFLPTGTAFPPRSSGSSSAGAIRQVDLQGPATGRSRPGCFRISLPASARARVSPFPFPRSSSPCYPANSRSATRPDDGPLAARTRVAPKCQAAIVGGPKCLPKCPKCLQGGRRFSGFGIGRGFAIWGPFPVQAPDKAPETCTWSTRSKGGHQLARSQPRRKPDRVEVPNMCLTCGSLVS